MLEKALFSGLTGTAWGLGFRVQGETRVGFELRFAEPEYWVLRVIESLSPCSCHMESHRGSAGTASADDEVQEDIVRIIVSTISRIVCSNS